jgi:hypothetical protein
MIKCIQNVIASSEVCDGKDNNCDGQIDNAPFSDDTGKACDTGLKGVCAAGTNTCTNAKITCTPMIMPGQLMEVCNGKDDNCDGQVDEGSPGAGVPCTVPGALGECKAGVTGCDSMGGQITCVSQYTPKPETCNGKDDDCNGSIDEGLNGSPCDTALPGVCGGPSSGTLTCANGVGNCVPKIGVGKDPEICDGLDNDCNGQVDDGNGNTLCTGTYPTATNVQTWTCGGGSCSIIACNPGFAHFNGSPASGCECATDGYAKSCSGTGNGVTVSYPGGSSTFSGIVETSNGEKWVRINFSGAPPAPGNWHAKVELTNTGSGKYLMDVFKDCTNPITCPDGNGKAATWEENYNGYVAGAGCCSNNTPPVTTVYARVYLAAGQTAGCTQFTITATMQ